MRRNNNFRFYSILLEKPCLQFKLFGCFARLTTMRRQLFLRSLAITVHWGGWNQFRSYVIVIALIRIERGNFKCDSHPLSTFEHPARLPTRRICAALTQLQSSVTELCK